MRGPTRWNGGACCHCGALRRILVLWHWLPPRVHSFYAGLSHPAHLSARARCLDREACEARVAKRTERARVRATCIVLKEPAAADAPLGICRWCGAALTGLNGSRRNYCYADREGRDCVKAWNGSRTYDARVVVRHRARAVGGGVRCVDCDAVCEPEDHAAPGASWVHWEADHEVALEDGGAHAMENLVCRCVPCHKAKTARECRLRATRRRAA